MIRKSLVAYLLAETAVTDLVGTRIYPSQVPQGQAKPFLMFQKVSRDHGLAFDGPTGLNRAVIQIDAYSTTQDGAETIVDALVTGAGLHGFRGTMNDHFVQACFVSDDTDALLPPLHGQDLGFFSSSLQLDLWYEP